jgi:hypothetical protein
MGHDFKWGKTLEYCTLGEMPQRVELGISLLNARQMKAVELLFERSNLQRGSLA